MVDSAYVVPQKEVADMDIILGIEEYAEAGIRIQEDIVASRSKDLQKRMSMPPWMAHIRAEMEFNELVKDNNGILPGCEYISDSSSPFFRVIRFDESGDFGRVITKTVTVDEFIDLLIESVPTGTNPSE